MKIDTKDAMLHPILTIITGKGDPNQAGILEHDEHGDIASKKVVGLRKAQQLLFQHAAAGDVIQAILEDPFSTTPYTSIRIYDRRDFQTTKTNYVVYAERKTDDND